MVGVRLPAKLIKKIEEVAGILSTNRSATIRFMLLDALKRGWTGHLTIKGRGGRFADQIARAVIAEQRADFAEAAAARPGATPEAEIKALRAAEAAAELRARLVDKALLQKALKPVNRPRAVTPPPRPSPKKGAAKN